MENNDPETLTTNSDVEPVGTFPGWIGFLIPIALIAVTGLVFWLFDGSPGNGQLSTGEAGTVTPGRDYYVMVSVVELTEKDRDGGAWDTFGGSAPDIYVQIVWRGHTVYTSETKPDTLVAAWSSAEIDPISHVLKGRHLSIDDVIQGARINIANDDTITIRVLDADRLRFDTVAGEKTLLTTELFEGKHTYLFEEPGIKRLVLNVIDIGRHPDLFGSGE